MACSACCQLLASGLTEGELMRKAKAELDASLLPILFQLYKLASTPFMFAAVSLLQSRMICRVH